MFENKCERFKLSALSAAYLDRRYFKITNEINLLTQNQTIMKKSIITFIRWGLVITVVTGVRGTNHVPQESMFSKGRWYLIDNEGMIWKRVPQDNHLLVWSGRAVLPKKMLKAYPEQRGGKYYQLEDGKLLFIEGNMP